MEDAVESFGYSNQAATVNFLSGETALGSSTNLSSSTYATLLTATVLMAPSQVLLLDFTAGFDCSATGSPSIYFRITINGTVLRSIRNSLNIPLLTTMYGCSAITARVAVGASGLVSGSNTVLVEWRRSSSTWTIDPTADGEHAVLRWQVVPD
jgi:hypothetical protein